jgi:hypothetical protein
MNEGIICPMKLPKVLDEIIVDLSMRGQVFNLLIRLKKCVNAIKVPLWLHLATNIVLVEFQV